MTRVSRYLLIKERQRMATADILLTVRSSIRIIWSLQGSKPAFGTMLLNSNPENMPSVSEKYKGVSYIVLLLCLTQKKILSNTAAHPIELSNFRSLRLTKDLHGKFKMEWLITGWRQTRACWSREHLVV